MLKRKPGGAQALGALRVRALRPVLHEQRVVDHAELVHAANLVLIGVPEDKTGEGRRRLPKGLQGYRPR